MTPLLNRSTAEGCFRILKTQPKMLPLLNKNLAPILHSPFQICLILPNSSFLGILFSVLSGLLGNNLNFVFLH